MSQIDINPRCYKQIHTTIVILGRKALEMPLGVFWLGYMIQKH